MIAATARFALARRQLGRKDLCGGPERAGALGFHVFVTGYGADVRLPTSAGEQAWLQTFGEGAAATRRPVGGLSAVARRSLRVQVHSRSAAATSSAVAQGHRHLPE